MGTALIGIVARRRSDKNLLSDSNNNPEIGECVFDSKELHLLETPPFGVVRHQPSQVVRAKPKAQAAKIGKIAKHADRGVGEEHREKVIVEVSHRRLSYQSVEPSDWLTARRVNVELRHSNQKRIHDFRMISVRM